MDYPLCALRRGWWRGERTCFHRDILTKTGTEREQRSRFAASPCLALHLYYFFLFIYLFFLVFIPPRVLERERCLQNCCAAPWLWSCMSTLWAPISATMTGTWVNEWHLAPCYYRHCLHYISPSIRVLYKGILMCSHSSCCHNSHCNSNV